LNNSIRTTTEKPITLKPYRIPHALRGEVKAALDEMLEQNIIQPSTSPWSSPTVLVRKRDNSLRVCVDYRKLNDVTVSDAYPTPRIDELLEKLADVKYISVMDLSIGYYQVPLSNDTREKFAFVTPFGLFEFLVMPFGMKTSVATFSRLMTKALHGLEAVMSYFDDIIIFTKTWEEHLVVILNVFERFRDIGISIRPSKCMLGENEAPLLGYIVGNGQIKVDPRKVKAMVEYPLPTTKKELRCFLGMTGYYRKFIDNFAKIAAPLTDCTKKDEPNKINWTRARN